VGPQDYYYSVWYNHTHHTLGPFVPASCCQALNKADLFETECQIVAVDQIIKQTAKVGIAFFDTHCCDAVCRNRMYREY